MPSGRGQFRETGLTQISSEFMPDKRTMHSEGIIIIIMSLVPSESNRNPRFSTRCLLLHPFQNSQRFSPRGLVRQGHDSRIVCHDALSHLGLGHLGVQKKAQIARSKGNMWSLLKENKE